MKDLTSIRGANNNINLIFVLAAVEFGFQRINYSVSEQTQLRDVSVCVIVNSGTFEREIEITFNVNDVTAESTKSLLITSL